MIGLKKALAISATAIFLTACASTNKLNDYEKVMVDKVWVTTDSIDNKGRNVATKDKRVTNFYGLAEYKKDGTFVMFTPEGQQKLAGDWSFSPDGMVRTIVAKDDGGHILFTRNVENITVKPDEYTYRIYPTATNKKQYIDIVHRVKAK